MIKRSSIVLLVIGGWIAIWFEILNMQLGVSLAVILVLAFMILWRDEIKEEELLKKLAILNPERPRERVNEGE